MKKTILLALMLSTQLFCEEFKPVCSPSQIHNILNLDANDTAFIGESSNGDMMIAITISSVAPIGNNKIKLWSTMLYSQKENDKSIKKYGVNYKPSGYTKALSFYNIENNTRLYVASTSYSCDGDTLGSYQNPYMNQYQELFQKWEFITPNSMGEAAFEEAKRIYNAKEK